MNASDVITSKVITIGRVAPVYKAEEGFPMHSSGHMRCWNTRQAGWARLR
jgi:hypothetical protein